jgi:cytochrome bd-type quinol oxidase subunit 2
MLQTQYYYNLIDAIVYLVAAIIPAYFILKSRNSINDNNNNHFRKLTMVLVGFILVQVIYHIAAIIGFRLLAKGFLEPLSMAALLFFGAIYLISTWKIRKQKQQQEELKT